jgi:hypothetical protein
MLLSHGTYMNNNWRPDGTRLGWTWTWLGNRAGMWLQLFRLCRLRTVCCIRHQSGHRLIIPSTYLLMGAGRLVALLSWVQALFGPTIMVDCWVGGLSTTLRPGLRCWRLGVPVWTGTWTPWQEWNGLVLFMPGVQMRRVFFGYLAGLRRFVNRRFYGTVRLDYALAP